MTTDLQAEIPLPGFKPEAPLWAVLIHGPERIDAMPDRDSAVREAEGIHDWIAALKADGRYDPRVVTWTGAEVIAWPGLRQAHAEELARRLAEDAG